MLWTIFFCLTAVWFINFVIITLKINKVDVYYCNFLRNLPFLLKSHVDGFFHQFLMHRWYNEAKWLCMPTCCHSWAGISRAWWSNIFSYSLYCIPEETILSQPSTKYTLVSLSFAFISSEMLIAILLWSSCKRGTEKIDLGVRQKAACLHNMATVWLHVLMQTFKDKARSDLKRAADQRCGDGALEVSIISVFVSVDLFLFLMLFNVSMLLPYLW